MRRELASLVEYATPDSIHTWTSNMQLLWFRFCEPTLPTWMVWVRGGDDVWRECTSWIEQLPSQDSKCTSGTWRQCLRLCPTQKWSRNNSNGATWRRTDKLRIGGHSEYQDRVPNFNQSKPTTTQHCTYGMIGDEMMDIMTALPPSNWQSTQEITNENADKRIVDKVLGDASMSCIVRSKHDLMLCPLA